MEEADRSPIPPLDDLEGDGVGVGVGDNDAALVPVIELDTLMVPETVGV